jgi:hypothetical protein
VLRRFTYVNLQFRFKFFYPVCFDLYRQGRNIYDVSPEWCTELCFRGLASLTMRTGGAGEYKKYALLSSSCFFSLPNVTHVFQTSEWFTNLTCICFELIAHEVPTILWYNSMVKYPTYYSFCFLSWSREEGNGSHMHNLNKKLDNTPYFKHSKSKFSQNTTNLLSKWRHVSTQGVIIRPIIEPSMRYIKWKCTFMGSKNNILFHIFWDPKTTFWDAKNVYFHLMYLIHGSIIALMMTPWVETCRHFNWQ